MWLKSFGLGITQGWLWLFFLNGPLLYTATAKSGNNPETVFMLFLLCNSLSYLFIAKMGRRLSPLEKKPLLLYLGIFVMTAGTLAAGLVEKDLGLFSNHLLITLGTLGSGFGSAVLISAWGERYSTLPANRSSLAFGIAVSVGTVIFFVLPRITLTAAILITALIPFISGLLLFRDSASNPTSASNPSSAPFPFPAKLVFLVILFYLGGGLMNKLITSGVQFSYYESFWLTNIVYFAVCLLAGGIVYFNPGLDLRYLYRPILPLLGIGFVLFPAVHQSYPVAPFTLLQSGFALFDLYTWVLFTYLATRHRFPVSVIAWGMFLITSAIFTGELLFTGIFPTIAANIKETDLISLFAAMLMFTGTLVFQDEPETFAGWNTPADSAKPEQLEESNLALKETAPVLERPTAEQRLKEQVMEVVLTVDRFALQYNLTHREKQILLLLLEGRNNPYIRDNLNISNNTLKTHLRNVYRKFCIKDRQELLDLYTEFRNSFINDI